MQRGFVELVETPRFSDIALKLHGSSLYAHKIILSCWSPVLRDLLLANPDQRELDLPLPNKEHSFEVLQQVLRFMYTGCVDITVERALPLLEMATTLKVESLQNKVGEFLFACEEKKDIGKLLDIAAKYQCKHLERRCATYLAERFDDCLKNDYLLNLPISTWKELLQRDEIKVSYEEDVFRAVIRYAQHQPDKQEVLKQLLPFVRFPLLSNRFLVEEVEFHPDLKDLPLAHDLIHEAYRYKLHKTDKDMDTLRAKPRKGGTKWSTTQKGEYIEIVSDGTSARHAGPRPRNAQSWQSVVAEGWLTSGVHTFEIKIDQNVSKWIFIGVATRAWKGYTDPTNGYLGHYADSWSFGSYSGWGKTHNSLNGAYGGTYITGDKVKVTVDMDNHTLSFAVNGNDYGVCHRDIADEVCLAVTLYKAGDQVTLL